MAGCASTSGKIATKTATTQTAAKVDPKLGVKASPRVVVAGAPIPKGGGRDMVGKPYKVAGKRYIPREQPGYSATGLASWYGDAFHGRYTANGEIYDMNHLSAAHTTMPLPSYARVTSVTTGRSVIVRVNDRGPFHGNRVLDLSKKAAELLGVRRAGVAKVKIDYVGRAPKEGDDTGYLMASYQGPADALPSSAPSTMFASAQPLPGVARKAAPAKAPAAAPVVAQPAQTVLIAALPPPRPALAATGGDYIVVAAADPAEAFFAAGAATTMVAAAPATTLAPTLVAANADEPLPVIQASMRGADEAAAIMATPATAFDAEPAAAAMPGVIVPLPPELPAQRSSYAAERIDGAYAAVDGFDSGMELSDLAARMQLRAQPAAAAPKAAGAIIQLGVFAEAANAARVADQLAAFGQVSVDDVTAGSRTLKRVRIVALADGVSVDTAMAAAARAGVSGAKLLR
ncbi:septal ring lytic transglycosylase RlpA family protein [Methylobrevis albus]|uniref:septal ring lytic transglycosylase RlpA family protein n=1 Tax=Methylobrevis albus TaxID=2793297 RepID=UPI001F36138C|nr:septal ring lytic transglycosylase RlpA family protein [Methylobrevis albus]